MQYIIIDDCSSSTAYVKWYRFNSFCRETLFDTNKLFCLVNVTLSYVLVGHILKEIVLNTSMMILYPLRMFYDAAGFF